MYKDKIQLELQKENLSGREKLVSQGTEVTGLEVVFTGDPKLTIYFDSPPNDDEPGIEDAIYTYETPSYGRVYEDQRVPLNDEVTLVFERTEEGRGIAYIEEQPVLLDARGNQQEVPPEIYLPVDAKLVQKDGDLYMQIDYVYQTDLKGTEGEVKGSAELNSNLSPQLQQMVHKLHAEQGHQINSKDVAAFSGISVRDADRTVAEDIVTRTYEGKVATESMQVRLENSLSFTMAYEE